jgi:dTDP-4-amino-4,6-dideoxygalactose transaminase
MGDAGAFSFHPRKSITTGEGGMVTTQNGELDTALRSFRDHGAGRSDHERHGSTNSFLLSDYARLGFNYRLTDIQAALGCAQMERVDWILQRRREVAARYDAELAGLDWLRTPAVPEGHTHAYQAYVCLFAPEEPSPANITSLRERRDAVMAELEAAGIATRQGTHSPVLQDLYRDRYELAPEAFFNSWAADWLTIALPLYPQMTEAEQSTVIDAVRAAKP